MASTPTRDRIKSQENNSDRKRLPPWLRVKFNNSQAFHEMDTLMQSQSLHTVCQEALCPNAGAMERQPFYCWEISALGPVNSAMLNMANPEHWIGMNRNASLAPFNS